MPLIRPLGARVWASRPEPASAAETRTPSRAEDWTRFTASPRALPVPRDGARPRTVEDTWQDVRLEQGAIALVLDASLARGSAKLSIPLDTLDVAPMTPEGFAAAIARVTVPRPWSFGQTTFRVEDGRLHVVAEGAEAGAWTKVPPAIEIHLASGQLVLVRASAPKIAADVSAFELEQQRSQRSNLVRLIETYESMIATRRAIAEDPEAGVPSTDVDALEAKRDATAARAGALRATLEARWAAATPLERVLVHSFLPGVEHLHRAELAANNRGAALRARIADLEVVRAAAAEAGVTDLVSETDADLATVRAALAAADAARDAAGAAIDAAIHDRDDLLAAAHVPLLGNVPQGQSFADLLRSAAAYERRIRDATADLEQRRARNAAAARDAIPGLEANLATYRARLADLDQRLAAPAAPALRWVPMARGDTP